MDGSAESVDIQKVTMDDLEELDFDVITDTPWAQVLWKTVEQHTKKGFLNWCHVVKNLAGTKNEYIQEWSKMYRKNIDKTLCNLVVTMLTKEKSMTKKIEELLIRLQNVCSELHQPMPQNIGEQKLSLHEEQQLLMKRLEKYEAIINAKKQELETLHYKQRKLCKHLGQSPKVTLQYPPLPTPAQLEEFQKYIGIMEEEKIGRDEKYRLLKHDIMAYVEEIKYKPNSDFERKILSSDNFLVTNENLRKLHVFAKCLKEITNATKEEIPQLRSRIDDLCKMLDVDLMDKHDSRTHYTGNSQDTPEGLRIKVKRGEEVIRFFVDKLRKKLECIWIKCHRFLDIEKRAFQPFNNDCYIYDLLDVHELEIQKWEKIYENNGKLLGLLEKHRELWEKLIQLEEHATGPNRYKNRGGTLLEEEKYRNKLSKMIPKIEEEIVALSKDYRNNNGGQSFLSYGKTPEGYIEHIHAEREHNRKLKLSTQKLQRETMLGHTPDKSAVSLFPPTLIAVTPPSPPSTTKHKIFSTPNSEKVKRLNTVKTNATPGSKPNIKVPHATLSLPNQKWKSRSFMNKRRRIEPFQTILTFNKADATRDTTFLDLQIEPPSSEKCQNTVLSDQIFVGTPIASPQRKIIQSGVTILKTPSRTPLIPRTFRSRTPKDSSNLKLLF